MSSIFSGKSGREASTYANQQIVDARNESLADLGTGATAQQQGYGTAQNLYGQLAAPAVDYSKLYADASGVNGADGAARAAAAFQAGPGYNFALNQGLDALDRRAASRGMLSSGNNTNDTINYATGTANQAWQQWLNNLQTGYGNAAQATNGQAQAAVGAGNAAYGYNKDVAGIKTNAADKIAQWGASGLMAGQQANANSVGAIFGGANLLANLAGKAFGAGSFGGGGATA